MRTQLVSKLSLYYILILLSSLLLHVVLRRWIEFFFVILTFFKLLLRSFQPLSHRCRMRKAGKLALLPFCFHPASFFTPRLAQQVCVRTPPPESSRWHMAAQAQMSAYVPGPVDDCSGPCQFFFPPYSIALGSLCSGCKLPPTPPSQPCVVLVSR